MDLERINTLFNNAKNNEFVKSFITEIYNNLNNDIINSKNIMEENTLKGSILTTEFRDKFNVEINDILINYADETKEKGKMYYIYSKNSSNQDMYNLSICDRENTNMVIEENALNLPQGSGVGTILRKNLENKYVIDELGTEEIKEKIENLEKNIYEEQENFLESRRIENHVYELSEKDEKSVWLFDITNNDDEAFEEIDFEKDIFENAEEGDKFIYKNGRYEKGNN